MRLLLVRGMLARKLRSVLTGVAVLLGVAMVAGTYVETDQINHALKGIFETANRGVDVVVLPRTAFESQFTELPPLPASLIDRVRAVPGVATAAGEIQSNGSLVVNGRYLGKGKRAPSLVFSTLPEPMSPARTVSGHRPRAHGEVAVNRAFAQSKGLKVGERAGLTTHVGVVPVRIVGIFDFGGQASLGAASIVTTTFPDAQAWFDRRGQTSSVVAAGEPGVTAPVLAARIRAVAPAGVKVQTGRERADKQASQISNAIGSFLTPVLLALAGAALLVGAFIIFNTFSITVAQRVREFALLRVLGATRTQVLVAVTGEALLLGVAASALGLAAGVGFARLLNDLFKAAGFEIPTTGVVLESRTVIVALAVGIGVTVVAALVPAMRATRVPEAAAVREGAQIPPSRFSRFAPYAAGGFVVLGAAALVQGLFGGGPATTRLSAVGGGAVLAFVGVAMSARWAVRPIAAVIGWPLERAFRAPGRLARENAMRNPARTAITAAALMVGLGLVVFVAVFAAGLKASFTDSVTRLVKADLIVTSQGGGGVAIPPESVPAIRRVPGVGATVPIRVDQVRVNGARSVNLTTDTIDGVDPRAIESVYAARWLKGGSAAVLARLGGDSALIEEQFAKTHRIAIGDRFTVTTPSGRTTSLRAVGEYRDPQILQGVVISDATFTRASSSRDPFIVLIRERPGASSRAVKAGVVHALAGFPEADVKSNAEYRKTIEDRLNQLVYLLYALLAMSVVISVFGIANSLALSIHERTREIGTLEAIGATERQVRRMVRYESVITAVIGGLLGTAVGLGLAWLMTRALADLGLVFSVPVAQLGGFLLLAVAVGVVAAAWPARRGARTDVMTALHYE